MQEPSAGHSRRDSLAAWLGSLGALVLFVGALAVFGAAQDGGTGSVAAGVPAGDGDVALGVDDGTDEAASAPTEAGHGGATPAHAHDPVPTAAHAHDDGTAGHDQAAGHHGTGTSSSGTHDDGHVDAGHQDDGHHDTGTAGTAPHDPGHSGDDGHHDPASPPAPGGNGGGDGGHDGGHGHPPTAPTTPGGTPPPHPHPPSPEPGPTGPIISLDDPRVTSTQRAAAQSLIDRTRYAMTAFPTVEAVQAAGYGWIGDGAGNGYEHWVNWSYLTDGRELDHARIESIVVERMPDGTKRVASAMYILEIGKTMDQAPDIAGELTTWHDHRNLCWRGSRLAGVLGPDGQCPPGSELRVTPPMLHVWMVAHPCGPFAGIEGGHGSGCGHDH